MRILHLISTLGGGGAERQVIYLADALAEIGHDAHIGYLSDGPNTGAAARRGLHLHRIRSSGNYDVRILGALKKLIRSIRPAIVQTWLPQMDILGGAACIATGVPWILSERNGAGSYVGGWKPHLRRFLARNAAAIVANSADGLKNWMSTVCGRKLVIRNIVPTTEIASAQFSGNDVKQYLATRPVVLFAGRLEPAKNILKLTEAFCSVAIRNPSAEFIVLGEGSLRLAAEAFVKNRGMQERIHFLGYRQDFWAWLLHADAFVSVSRVEGHPNVVLEAMACRCPLVVSDIGAHREFLNETSAWFVNQDSTENIATTIDQVLTERSVAMTRASMAYEGLMVYTARSVAKQYADLYSEIATSQGQC